MASLAATALLSGCLNGCEGVRPRAPVAEREAAGVESAPVPQARPAPAAAVPEVVPAGSPAPPIHASLEELRALGADLAIPIAGIEAADLHDSYSEARGARVHEAIDIAAPVGTPILSAADGRLLKLHESTAGGHMVYAADRSDRFLLIYSHLDRYADGLVEGMPLQQGQLLGYVGISGNAAPESPHLHFAITRGTPRSAWWLGTPVNPYPLLSP
jgi:peptidoglycan LD-endopeptidase LytH